jgi:hypothetical protein
MSSKESGEVGEVAHDIGCGWEEAALPPQY